MQYKAKVKTWYLVKDFEGEPKQSDFELEEEDKTFDSKDMQMGGESIISHIYLSDFDVNKIVKYCEQIFFENWL
jgi:hypothetical protein